MAQSDWTITKSDPSISFNCTGNYLIATAATQQALLLMKNPAVNKVNLQWEAKLVRGGPQIDILACYADSTHNYRWTLVGPSNGSNQYYNFLFYADEVQKVSLVNRWAGWSMYGYWTWFKGEVVSLADGSNVIRFWCNVGGGGYQEVMNYVDVAGTARPAGNYGMRLINNAGANTWWVQQAQWYELT